MAPSHAKLNFLKYIKNGDSDTLEHSGVCMPILVFHIYLTISYWKFETLTLKNIQQHWVYP